MSLIIPSAIERALEKGAVIAVSISGGKDSFALAKAISDIRAEHGWAGEIFTIHAHLGAAEWPETLPLCESLSAQFEMPLVVVAREGGLAQRISEREISVAGKGIPPFPSPKARFCTSDTKTNVINKHLRNFDLVISAEGVRAQESGNRAKKNPLAIRAKITGKKYLNMSLKG